MLAIGSDKGNDILKEVDFKTYSLIEKVSYFNVIGVELFKEKFCNETLY